jgi:hypothetical protein
MDDVDDGGVTPVRPRQDARQVAGDRGRPPLISTIQIESIVLPEYDRFAWVAQELSD